MAARLTAIIVVIIVAATLIAGLLVGAQRDDHDGPIDLIVFNGNVYTGQAAPFAEALAVRGNRILRVGSNRAIKRLRRRQTIAIDAHGGAVLPGFNDSHLHLLSGGLALVKDAKPDEPTGAPTGGACARLESAIPPLTRGDRLAALRAAVAEAHRYGITSVQETCGRPDEFELYDELRRTGDLKVRVYSALRISPGFSEADADRLDHLRQTYPDDPFFRIGAVTIEADGGREAHMPGVRSPNANKLAKGHPEHSPDELSRLVSLMDRHEWQVFVDATGDRGVRLALDAYERAALQNPAPPRGRRHRIEHVETIDTADIPRLARLGVIASVQPFDGKPDPERMDGRMEHLGPDRIARGWFWKGITGAGGRLVFGSDWPRVSLDPSLGIGAAINQVAADGDAANLRLRDERLALADAIDAYTSGAAYASFDEHRKGTLAPGMLADIVIMSADIFSLPASQILDATVETTIFGGEIVYRRNGPHMTEP
ncbi:MAG: amidohydrolase family protein [Acidobacteria bacterium]|nr:amidohydrolase family protein [Acidobacteriota bacterium]